MGWRGGSAPFVLFLNDDCEIDEENIEKMLTPFGDPNVGIVGPTLHCGDYQCREENAPMENGEYPLYITVRHLIGACMLVRREVLERIDGWDTDFILMCSDLDLCIRSWEAGYSSVWAVTAKADHVSKQTVSEIPEDELDHISTSDGWRFKQKYPDEELFNNRVITLRGFGDGYKVVYPKDIKEKALTPA
jgi:GT2 family glycosyltransferase